jgi:hypothetical protein
VPAQQRCELGDALGDRLELERPVGVDVRCDRDVANTLGGEAPGVSERCGLIVCSVIGAGEQMKVQIDI